MALQQPPLARHRCRQRDVRRSTPPLPPSLRRAAKVLCSRRSPAACLALLKPHKATAAVLGGRPRGGEAEDGPLKRV